MTIPLPLGHPGDKALKRWKWWAAWEGEWAVAELAKKEAQWNKERQKLPKHSISYKPGGSQGQHGKEARKRRGPPPESMANARKRILEVARSICKRKLNTYREEKLAREKKRAKRERLDPMPRDHVKDEIGNDCTWGVLYLILREFMNRSLTPVKGRSLTPLRHRAHGPLPHFESNSCTGPMSRILNHFMRRSLTLFMGGLLRIFLMGPCHISRRGVALFDGQGLLQGPPCSRAPPGPLKIGMLRGRHSVNLQKLEYESDYKIKIFPREISHPKADYCEIQGLPKDVDEWKVILWNRYRGRKIKSKVVDGSTILIMAAMAVAAFVYGVVVISIFSRRGCPWMPQVPRGGPEFVFTPLFDSLFQFYFPPTVWHPRGEGWQFEGLVAG